MSWWIKDFTSTLQWGWFTDVPTAHFWEYVRLRANREDDEWHGIPVKRGSFISSVSHMAIETGLSEKQVRLAINKLEKTGEITTERTNKYTLINVVKYADYQGFYIEEGKQAYTQRDMQRDTQRVSERATNKEDKEDKKIRGKENIKKSEAVKIEGSQELTEAFEALIEVRKAKKVPNTERAVRQIISKLEKLAPNDEAKKIELLNTAVERGWSTVFETITPQKKGDVWFE